MPKKIEIPKLGYLTRLLESGEEPKNNLERQFLKLLKEIRASENITGKDLAIIINAKG